MVFVADRARLFNMAKQARQPAAIKKPPPRGAAKKVWKRIYLREWREHRGLSVEALAEKASVSPGLISQIENKISAGSADSLEKLAKILQITVGELLDVKPEPNGAILRVWVPNQDRATVQAMIASLAGRH